MSHNGFAGAKTGNVALAVAIVAPILVSSAGAGVDASRFVSGDCAWQEAAEAGANAGARPFFLHSNVASSVEPVVRLTAEGAISSLAESLDAEAVAEANANRTQANKGSARSSSRLFSQAH